jgi:hypothetical protein
LELLLDKTKETDIITFFIDYMKKNHDKGYKASELVDIHINSVGTEKKTKLYNCIRKFHRNNSYNNIHTTSNIIGYETYYWYSENSKNIPLNVERDFAFNIVRFLKTYVGEEYTKNELINYLENNYNYDEDKLQEISTLFTKNRYINYFKNSGISINQDKDSYFTDMYSYKGIDSSKVISKNKNNKNTKSFTGLLDGKKYSLYEIVIQILKKSKTPLTVEEVYNEIKVNSLQSYLSKPLIKRDIYSIRKMKDNNMVNFVKHNNLLFLTLNKRKKQKTDIESINNRLIEDKRGLKIIRIVV